MYSNYNFNTILLKKVLNEIKLKGYILNNIDINIITQKPKISKLTRRIYREIVLQDE